jgi:drug/metabolite transporter (DMT)-like permease
MGEIAALFTAICWAFTSIFFSVSGKLVGSAVVNRIRLLFASILLALAHYFIHGSFLPMDASLERWGVLGLSGIIGLALGDALLFQAYVLIGPRITTLLMALAPVFGTLVAWIFLEEILTLMELVGIAVTIAGIAWVVLEKRNGTAVKRREHLVTGVLLGLGAAICQALGLILSKVGLAGGYSALSGVEIRILVAMVAIWFYSALRGELPPMLGIIRAKPISLAWIGGGAMVGPFIGVWLSLIAVQLSPVGVASTLMALSPVFVMPLSVIFFREKISPRAVFGTIAAMIGVAVITIFV